MLVNAAFSFAEFVFEVPTGVVADTLGRRVSLLFCLITLLGATLAYVALPALGLGFWSFVLVSIALGLGFTFWSGAAEAWLVACFGAALFSALAASSAELGELLGGAFLALCFAGLPCAAVYRYVRDRGLRLGLAPGIVP